MSSQSFNYGLSPDVFDHGLAQERERQEKERRQAEYEERVALWITRALAGQRFTDLETLRAAALAAAEATGHDITEHKRATIRVVCVGLMFGFVDPRKFQGRVIVTRGEGVRFPGPPRAA